MWILCCWFGRRVWDVLVGGQQGDRNRECRLLRFGRVPSCRYAWRRYWDVCRYAWRSWHLLYRVFWKRTIWSMNWDCKTFETRHCGYVEAVVLDERDFQDCQNQICDGYLETDVESIRDLLRSIWVLSVGPSGWMIVRFQLVRNSGCDGKSRGNVTVALTRPLLLSLLLIPSMVVVITSAAQICRKSTAIEYNQAVCQASDTNH